jgi:hypothetical protein
MLTSSDAIDIFALAIPVLTPMTITMPSFSRRILLFLAIAVACVYANKNVASIAAMSLEDIESKLQVIQEPLMNAFPHDVEADNALRNVLLCKTSTIISLQLHHRHHL